MDGVVRCFFSRKNFVKECIELNKTINSIKMSINYEFVREIFHSLHEDLSKFIFKEYSEVECEMTKNIHKKRNLETTHCSQKKHLPSICFLCRMCLALRDFFSRDFMSLLLIFHLNLRFILGSSYSRKKSLHYRHIYIELRTAKVSKHEFKCIKVI